MTPELQYYETWLKLQTKVAMMSKKWVGFPSVLISLCTIMMEQQATYF